jgi:phage head maturation protease
VKAPDVALGPVEHRESSVANVRFPERIIEVIVVPYDEPALVEYRNEMWKESFERGAWDGIEKTPDWQPERIKANRDHDRTRLVGKAVRLEPSRQEGLVADVRIAPTDLGDETLALADEKILGVSAGFAARLRDQIFDRKTMTRRIKKAFLDHIAFLGTPAYQGAAVLNIREDGREAAELPKLVTPALDELVAWQQSLVRRRGGRVA